MNKADYTFRIDGDVLFIEDIGNYSLDDIGNRSIQKTVTNDIENVLSEISKELNTSISNFKVIYRDSDGNIDGVRTKDNKFVDFYPIGEREFYAAKLKIKNN